MKKKILLGLCGLLCLSCFVGCGEDRINKNNNYQNYKENDSNNVFVDTGDSFSIDYERFEVYYDKNTKIVYLFNDEGMGDTSRVSLCPYYNKNRQPMTIDEYNEINKE